MRHIKPPGRGIRPFKEKPLKSYEQSSPEAQSFWSDKKIVITGGTAGLGSALALTLTDYSAAVVVVGRSVDRFEALPFERRSKIHFIAADVADKRSNYRIAGEALGILGRVDVLVNNASYL